MKIVLPWEDDGMLIGDRGMWIGGADRRERGLGFGIKPGLSGDSTVTKRADGISQGRGSRLLVPVQPCIPGMLKPSLGENLHGMMKK